MTFDFYTKNLYALLLKPKAHFHALHALYG